MVVNPFRWTFQNWLGDQNRIDNYENKGLIYKAGTKTFIECQNKVSTCTTIFR